MRRSTSLSLNKILCAALALIVLAACDRPSFIEAQGMLQRQRSELSSIATTLKSCPELAFVDQSATRLFDEYSTLRRECDVAQLRDRMAHAGVPEIRRENEGEREFYCLWRGGALGGTWRAGLVRRTGETGRPKGFPQKCRYSEQPIDVEWAYFDWEC